MNTAIEARATVTSPLGPLLLAATTRGLAGAWFVGQRHAPATVDADDDPAHPHLRRAAEQLDAYWRAPRHRFELALDAGGSAFQRAVWQALLEIGSGALASYGDIARRIGRPTAVRAVGAAIGRNPISIIVPCHRVVGGSGALTGYAGGLERKRSLLAHEGAL